MTKDRKPPAFQFYAKDWLSSTQIALMKPAQEGGYIRLLAHCWDSGDCSLPDNDEDLCSLSRLSVEELRVVRRCFIKHPHKEGFLTNERLLDELLKQQNWRQKCSEGGKKSGKTRGKKPPKSETQPQQVKGTSDLLATKREVNPQVKPNSSSSSSLKKEGEDSLRSSSPPPTPKKGKQSDLFELPDWLTQEAGKEWKEFMAMRLRIRKPMEPGAIKMAIATLTGLRNEGHKPAEVLMQSVYHCWAGLFKIKNKEENYGKRTNDKGTIAGIAEVIARNRGDNN